MEKLHFAKELYNRYGTVTRARNCFLYTKKNVRITDMYQEDGRAILGWDAGNAFTFFKNILCRGQVGSFICEDHNRVEKAVSTLLDSDRQIFYFSNKTDAVKAAISISPTSTSVYKPWNTSQTQLSSNECIIIAPPLPWTDTLWVLAVTLKEQKSVLSETPANTISIPFAMEAAIARSIYNLVDALNSRQEKDWFIYDTILTKYWERKGPYLYPKMPKEKYDEFILHCLDLGIAINPDYNSPSIIPFGADKGVFTALKNSPFDF